MKEHSFDTDIIMAPRRSEKRAWIVAGVSTGVSVLMALSIATMMPLKTTEVFTVLVDRDTGDAERIMQVQPTGIEDEQAVKESLLVSYVSDRESFLMAGIQERLESVQRRSAGGARRSLVALWSNDSDNESYPPRLYGQGAEVTVRVKTITFLEPTVAQVRYEKSLRTPRQDSVTRDTGYEYAGGGQARPVAVWNDGHATYFEFREGVRPSIFAVDGEGYELTVNSQTRGRVVRVGGVAEAFTIRIGDEVICIRRVAGGKTVDPFILRSLAGKEF